MTKHRATGTPTYKVWTAMHYRCNNPKSGYYQHYGGRGIKVCKRWGEFVNFLEDMGEKPSNLSLDRINNNGNYTPKNCRWATAQQQNENSSRMVWITYQGVKKTRKAWAQTFGIRPSTLAARMTRYGLSFQDAIKRKPFEHLIGNTHNKKYE